MKLERSLRVLYWTFTGLRMRQDNTGPWVKRSHFEEWRNYALALESKLKMMEEKDAATGNIGTGIRANNYLYKG